MSKHIIRGTFEVTFDPKDLPQFEGEGITDDQYGELLSEWMTDGCDALETEVVPCLNAESILLQKFEITRLWK